MRDPFERLRDIQEAIANIMKYTDQGRDSFDQDELVQTWVIHHLEIIGEAARTGLFIRRYRGNKSMACEIFLSTISSVSIEIVSGLWSNMTF